MEPALAGVAALWLTQHPKYLVLLAQSSVASLRACCPEQGST